MASQPTRLDNLRTLRNANLDGAFATAFATLVGGTFLVGFVKECGGSDLWIGWLTAIPSLLGLVQIVGAVIGRSKPSYKRYVLPGGLLWRLLYAPIVLLPLVALAADAKLWILGGCIAAASLCVLMVNPTYNDWLAEMVPESSRGWFFSRRNAIMAGVGTGMGAVGGLVLDLSKEHGRAAQGFAAVFGIGLLCAGISMFFFLRMADVPRSDPIERDFRSAMAAFRKPFADRGFRPVVLFFVAFFFGQTFPGNLFGAYALETLHLPFTLIQICGAAQALGSILASRFWGYLADKYGNRPLLLVLGLGIALTPVCWMFTTPGQLAWNATILIAGHIYSGVVWGGVSVCQFNLMLATASGKDRATYIGVGLAIQALIGGIAPLMGAETMALARSTMGAAGAYHVVFWSTIGLRVLSIAFLFPVREVGSVGMRETLRKLSRISPKGYAALRSLSQSDSAQKRESAIHAVASQNFSLASEEVIQALHDPSPRVRRQAAMALATLGDVGAAAALVHQLEEHPDLVEDETIEALGELRSHAAVPSLIRHLQSPKSSTRRASARALGRIGDVAAISPLMLAASDKGDADLRRASLQALRVMGAVEAEPVILNALLDPYPSVRIAAAEAIDELMLVGALDNLRESMKRYDDEAESEVAYALGSIGDVDDIPAILAEAQKCVSVTTRRRCLLGVAKVLGVEPEVYRFLLSEGMSRDRELIDQWAAIAKRNRRFQVVLNTYASGDEPGAIEQLSKIVKTKAMRSFAATPVDELFLVAAAWVRKHQHDLM